MISGGRIFRLTGVSIFGICGYFAEKEISSPSGKVTVIKGSSAGVAGGVTTAGRTVPAGNDCSRTGASVTETAADTAG